MYTTVKCFFIITLTAIQSKIPECGIFILNTLIETKVIDLGPVYME